MATLNLLQNEPGARLIIEVKGEIQASGPFLFLFSPACLVTPGRGKIREKQRIKLVWPVKLATVRTYFGKGSIKIAVWDEHHSTSNAPLAKCHYWVHD